MANYTKPIVWVIRLTGNVFGELSDLSFSFSWLQPRRRVDLLHDLVVRPVEVRQPGHVADLRHQQDLPRLGAGDA